jgi:hypothetical protein
LLAAFRLLSTVVTPDDRLPALQPKSVDDQALLVEASEIDVAAAIRSIDGVRKVTREAGGIWLVAADADIRATIARIIVGKGGALTLLARRAVAGPAAVRSARAS